jgi:uncharacterized protein DUF6602
MNTVFRDIYLAKAHALTAAAASFSAVKHGPLLGQLREQLITQFLEPLLPPGIGIGQGIIVDSTNRTSPQQDFIIYDRSRIAPALVGGAGVFPIDTVLYTLEIKSNLTLAGLKRSHENARKVLSMGMLLGQVQASLPIPGLIAFKSSLPNGGRDVIDRYRKIVRKGPDEIFGLRMICIAGAGYWFFDRAHRFAPDWTEGELSLQRTPGMELLDLVSSIINGYVNQRHGRTSDLNSYLVETGAKVSGHAGLEYLHPEKNTPNLLKNQLPKLGGPSGPQGPLQH